MKKIMHYAKNVFSTFRTIIQSFSFQQRLLFGFGSLMMTLGAIGILVMLQNTFSQAVPVNGGTYTEGIVGTPRFINPVLSRVSADNDVIALVYAGLMRYHNGKLITDMAESYTVSDDGLVYTFTLHPSAVFHDGVPVTADDVTFTINKFMQSTLNSDERAKWRGVKVETLDRSTVQFTLNDPYANFLTQTTFGILPEHLWGSFNADQFVSSEYNIQAVGSGPFSIVNIDRDRLGIPQSITLKPFKKYVAGKPYVEKIILKFYGNEEERIRAFKSKEIDTMAVIDPATAITFKDKNNIEILDTALPRVFGIFLNKNQQTIFLDSDVILAIDTALGKDAIVRHVLSGFGTALDGPLSPVTPGYEKIEKTETTSEERLQKAGEILNNAGWKLDTKEGVRVKNNTALRFTLATSNIEQTKETATMIKEQLAELGIFVEVQIFENGNLEQDVIRPRKYDALLFGQALEEDTHLYAFWHSSQRNDPGLNVGMFANTSADTALEKSLQSNDRDQRGEYYKTLATEIEKVRPAVFLYSPHIVMVTRDQPQGIDLSHVRFATDRYNNIMNWYYDTDRQWNIFHKKSSSL